MKKSMIGAIALLVPVAMAGCTTTNPYTGEQQASRTARGTVGGAAAGAALGTIIGAISGDVDVGTGAAVGAIAGAGVGGVRGAYQDRQEAELRQELASTGVRVQRNGDNITLIMPGNILFASDQATIDSGFYATLNSVAKVIARYDQTTVWVQGHTDSTGSDAYNNQLSVQRAVSVGNYLAGQGVAPQRIDARGYGETRPISSNETASGRQQNRRVEIELVPTNV
ncbi:MAG: OmpA family protein [Pseudomonadota bacterium]